MFPNLPFAIVFVGILAAVLGYAAYVDWTTMKVPKWLTIGVLGCGVLLGVVRGAWLGAEGNTVWLLPDGAFLGAIDGLLLALSGFVLGFILFFGFWIFGLGGGGDVKLVAATGAWLGWFYILCAIALSLPFLVIVTVFVMGYRLTGGKMPQTAVTTGFQAGGRRRSVTTYSLPFALGVYVILSWMMVQYVNHMNAGS